MPKFVFNKLVRDKLRAELNGCIAVGGKMVWGFKKMTKIFH